MLQRVKRRLAMAVILPSIDSVGVWLLLCFQLKSELYSQLQFMHLRDAHKGGEEQMLDENESWPGAEVMDVGAYAICLCRHAR
ncbi:hypothetical protein BJ741DRAFT_597507 [Chytriomyces cf. hyalinus JEL632]|nr:hypothetical protein BJ741DRAFT_597507 [Chytriomyces cf. hyalinus JEL632]